MRAHHLGLLLALGAGCSDEATSDAVGGAGSPAGENSTGGASAAGSVSSVAGGGAGAAPSGGTPAVAGTATGGSAAGASGSGASGGGGVAGATGSAAGGVGGVAVGGGGSGGAGGAAGGAGGATGGSAGAGGAFGVCSGKLEPAATVHVIGDSTASVYAANVYPRMGWGQPLGELFDSRCATVKDEALSGRSSKSFSDEGHWTPIKNALKAGDYVVIQFGHNDEKSDDPTRYTEPQTTYKQFLTMYVNDTKAKGATPLLATPINRNSWSGTKLSDTHGAYPGAMRELADTLDVELIDMTALTKQYFERIGQAETTKLFMVLSAGQFPNYPSGNSDNTHLQETGARKLGQLAMADAYAQRLRLGSLLKAVPSAP